MKLSYMYFLAKSSLKGNRKSFAVMFITTLFVIALTVVTSLSSAVVGAVNGYKDDYFARSFMITPYNRPLDDKVISQISFVLNQGEFIAIMGASGSGKSTLMQVSGLLDSCTKGEIFINGNKTSDLNDKEFAKIRQKSIGFVFQSFHLNPHIKLYENVMMPMLINRDFKNKKEMEEKAKQLLELVGLAHRINHYPTQVSGGEQQRVAIARALSNAPDFILADEPTGNLDSKNEEAVFTELKKLSKSGKGVLVVSHNDAVTCFADKVYTMKDGVLTQ